MAYLTNLNIFFEIWFESWQIEIAHQSLKVSQGVCPLMGPSWYSQKSWRIKIEYLDKIKHPWHGVDRHEENTWTSWSSLILDYVEFGEGECCLVKSCWTSTTMEKETTTMFNVGANNIDKVFTMWFLTLTLYMLEPWKHHILMMTKSLRSIKNNFIK